MLQVQFKFDKSITYWSSEYGANRKIDGELSFTHWSNDISHCDKSVSINSLDEVESSLKEILQNNYLPTDYFIIMDDGRISFNTIEDGENDIVSSEDAKKIEADGGQLYICDYSVYIEIQEVYEPTIAQLQTIFPKAEY